MEAFIPCGFAILAAVFAYNIPSRICTSMTVLFGLVSIICAIDILIWE